MTKQELYDSIPESLSEMKPNFDNIYDELIKLNADELLTMREEIIYFNNIMDGFRIDIIDSILDNKSIYLD